MRRRTVGACVAPLCWAFVLPAWAAQTVSLEPEADNWISSCSSGCAVNNGAMSELRGRSSWWGPAGDEEPKNFRSLLRFDLSSLPDDPSLIVQADLALYYWDRPHDDPVGRTYDVLALTNSWDEMESSWQARDDYNSAEPLYWDSYTTGVPAYQPGGGDFDPVAYASTQVPADISQWMIWDVTDLIDDWLSGVVANEGLLIKDSEEIEADPGGGSVSWLARFRSGEYSEAEFRPYLEVTYVPEPSSTALLGFGLVLAGVRRHRSNR